MPKLSTSALKARITALQKQLVAAESKKAPAVKKVRALMKKLGVSVADLAGDKAPQRRNRPPKTAKVDGAFKPTEKKLKKRNRGKVAIKYRDDKGNNWTGRGKTPRWMVEAERSGAKRESFFIK